MTLVNISTNLLDSRFIHLLFHLIYRFSIIFHLQSGSIPPGINYMAHKKPVIDDTEYIQSLINPNPNLLYLVTSGYKETNLGKEILSLV